MKLCVNIVVNICIEISLDHGNSEENSAKGKKSSVVYIVP